MKRWIHVIRCLLVPLCLAAVCAWLVSSYLAPRPFLSSFWLCLGCTAFVSLVLKSFNVVEAGVIFILYLTLVILSTSIARRRGAPAAPYFAVSALVAGFASSRAYRIGKP